MTAAKFEIIPVSDAIELRAVEERYTADLHYLVVKNRTFLQTAFDWAQHVGTEEDTRRNVQSNQMLRENVSYFSGGRTGGRAVVQFH